MKIYISFGQSHAHQIGEKFFNKDCLAEIDCESVNEGREVAWDNFGNKFFTNYDEEDLVKIIDLFPRGVIKLN